MSFVSSIVISAALVLTAPPSAAAYQVANVDGAGAIAGTVKFAGNPPDRVKIDIDKDVDVCGKQEKFVEDLVIGSDGGLQNAVVYLASVAKGKAWPSEPATLDQNGCRFEPHVALVAPDTDLAVLNSDNILHNLHSYSDKNRPFNVAQPKFKKKMTKKFAQPEFVRVTCDAHRWMQGYVVVTQHPYYAVTDASGAFKLEDVPPGDYELRVWHERLGEKAQAVSVKAGAESAATFEFTSK